ncbi:hypothetical protein HSX11_10790 [Oxalobacteraceae bacterium]|nr:hypothetical protein [Oxalobacteraceae bacterium]
MRLQLERSAIANGRSMHAEILCTLQIGMATQRQSAAQLSEGDLLHELIRRFGGRLNLSVSSALAEQAGIQHLIELNTVSMAAR